MHDIKWIREHKEEFDSGLARRGLVPQAEKLLTIDESWRKAIHELETAQARRNVVSKEVGAAKKSNEEETAQKLLAEIAELKRRIPQLEERERGLAGELIRALEVMPNLPLPAPEVPDGKDEHDNVEHHKYCPKRTDGKREVEFEGFKPKQHFELGEALGQMDFETAATLSGARFVVLKNGLARLERALGQFMLDLHTGENKYTEVNPPLLVRDHTMFGTAQLPKFEDDQFKTETFSGRQIESMVDAARKEAQGEMRIFLQQTASGLRDFENPDGLIARFYSDERVQARAKAAKKMTEEVIRLARSDQQWLIPTAEVPLTNLVREKILAEQQLPLRLTALTPCFRAEAGAAGKDTRGMIRQHQFSKVELVSITTPEQSADEHGRMLDCAEEVLRRLDLHYRVVTLCTGDMGFAAQKTYDIEVWLPGQGAYREISSCSACGEFQARRMNARYRDDSRQVRYLHTLNGSGVAVGRALIAVMENYQQQDGSIAVPDVLQPYMGGRKTIEHAG